MKKIIIIFFILLLATVALGAAPEATQLNYIPSPAIPGSTIDILVQLENSQNQVEDDVVVTINNDYPFTVVGDLEKNIGTLEKYGKTIVTFTVAVDPSAESKTYNITVNVKSKQNPFGKGKTFPIIISGKEPVVKVVGLTGETLIPGQEQELSFNLKNIGTSIAYDIIIELQEDRTITATGTIVEREITPLGAATAYVATINPGEEKEGKIRVNVNRTAELKNYTLPIEVSYRNSSGTRSTETSYVGFKVTGAVELDSTIKDNPIAIVAGVETELNIELFNKGIGKAEYTLVEISTENGTVEKPKQFIGALEPNDVDSFKVKVTFDKDTPTSEQVVKLLLTYQDTDALTKTKEIDLKLKIYSQADGAAIAGVNPLTSIINIILIIIVVFVIWKGYKKFKK